MTDIQLQVYEEPIRTPNYQSNSDRKSEELTKVNHAKKSWIMGSVIILAICTVSLFGIDIYLFSSLNALRSQLNSMTTVIDYESKTADTTDKMTTLVTIDSGMDKENCSGSAGVTRIYPDAYQLYPGTMVYCDNETDGGGWIVFQRRQDGSVNFIRYWADYVDGFGNLEGEYWMGLEKLHRLTSNGNHELRIDLEDWEGNRTYAKYSTFSVGSSSDNYRLRVGRYSGTAGDGMTYHHNQQFSALDRDNDVYSRHCSQIWKGGWWFYHCFRAHLNGVYRDQKERANNSSQGIIWNEWKGQYYSLKFTEMKFRLKQD